jgi:hypothetical protein
MINFNRKDRSNPPTNVNVTPRFKESITRVFFPPKISINLFNSRTKIILNTTKPHNAIQKVERPVKRNSLEFLIPNEKVSIEASRTEKASKSVTKPNTIGPSNEVLHNTRTNISCFIDRIQINSHTHITNGVLNNQKLKTQDQNNPVSFKQADHRIGTNSVFEIESMQNIKNIYKTVVGSFSPSTLPKIHSLRSKTKLNVKQNISKIDGNRSKTEKDSFFLNSSAPREGRTIVKDLGIGQNLKSSFCGDQKKSFFLEGRSPAKPKQAQDTQVDITRVQNVDSKVKILRNKKIKFDELCYIKRIYEQADKDRLKVQEHLARVEETISNIRARITFLNKCQMKKLKKQEKSQSNQKEMLEIEKESEEEKILTIFSDSKSHSNRASKMSKTTDLFQNDLSYLLPPVECNRRNVLSSLNLLRESNLSRDKPRISKNATL